MRRILCVCLAAGLLLCGGCSGAVPTLQTILSLGKTLSSGTLAPADETAVTALTDKQLGLLASHVTTEEYATVYDLIAQLYPLRQARLKDNSYRKTRDEKLILEELNALYEEYTVRYIEDGGDWGYDSPKEITLAEYDVDHDQGGTITGKVVEGDWSDDDYQAMWDQILGILPDGAWEDFTKFTLFTDGPDETLAWVWYVDDDGAQWELAVDPADADDSDWFNETILHEYTHYLTLNNDQVTYNVKQTADTYNEDGMVSCSDSYLDDFYQAFWTDYLDDRLQNEDTYNFFLRHEDDFITDYASTDPSEDIAESFTYFVLLRPQRGDAVWQQKLTFFYDYPELVELRRAIRQNLDLGV